MAARNRACVVVDIGCPPLGSMTCSPRASASTHMIGGDEEATHRVKYPTSSTWWRGQFYPRVLTAAGARTLGHGCMIPIREHVRAFGTGPRLCVLPRTPCLRSSQNSTSTSLGE